MNYKLLIAMPVILAAITVSLGSSTKSPKLVNLYAIYDGAGDQNDIDSYTITEDVPSFCHGHDALCFFRIVDTDGILTPLEFNTAFEALDVTDTGLNSLDDEAEVAGVLEKYTLSK